MTNELQKISERYQRRSQIPDSRYSRLSHAVNFAVQDRQKALVGLFHHQGFDSLADLSILEVGCGTGGNLLELIQFGAAPQKLVGNELLPDRIEEAANRLPQAVKLYFGDASKLDLPDESFDIIYQSTVFSSILDDDLQVALSRKMWNLLRPGGGILWYDFVYDNPRNPDVRGVGLNRIRELFPAGEMAVVKKLTLAPPIARYVVKLSPALYSFFNIFPFLRTHVLCYIEKNEQ